PQGVQLRPATRGSRWRCAGGPLRAITATAAGAALGTAIPLSRGLRPGVSVEARLPAVERTRHLPELGPGGRNPRSRLERPQRMARLLRHHATRRARARCPWCAAIHTEHRVTNLHAIKRNQRSCSDRILDVSIASRDDELAAGTVSGLDSAGVPTSRWRGGPGSGEEGAQGGEVDLAAARGVELDAGDRDGAEAADRGGGKVGPVAGQVDVAREEVELVVVTVIGDLVG